MAYTTIDKPDDYFNTILYTGTGATNAITGVGFQPDFFWFKNRGGNYHVLGDSIRGITKFLYSNDTSAEVTNTTVIDSLDADGYTLGNNSNASEVVNISPNSMVSWNWLANGAGVSNTAGSITSTVSANTTSGFSIVSYTGNATAGATIGHSLGTTPSMIIAKRRSAIEDWGVYHKSMGASKYINLNTTTAEQSSTSRWNGTEPTPFVFSVNTHESVNASGDTYIAYCFADVKGFSKAFSYTGNGSADGVFTYCGFKPAFLLVKSTGADNWCMLDNKRDTFNVMDKRLFPNLSNAESTGVPTVVDFVSNGFKLRTSDSSFNLNGQSFIGFAIAEHPFVTSTSVPTTAR